jgi:hypothetical protein
MKLVGPIPEGAVHVYHTECPPRSSAGTQSQLYEVWKAGSPVWAVASTVVPVRLPLAPLITVALAKLSLPGGVWAKVVPPGSSAAATAATAMRRLSRLNLIENGRWADLND